MIDERARFRSGLLFGLGAYSAWGLFPIYFKALANTLPTELVAHRILWSLLFVGILAACWRRWRSIASALKNPRILALLTLTTSLIGINWLTYVWAVVNGHVLEGSLGYYLTPLVNVLLGTLLLKEKLSPRQTVAVGLAAAGVAVLAAGAGQALWISLVVAATFGLYGFFRKIAPVEALEGLSVETLVMAPLALGWILWIEAHGQGHFDDDRRTTLLLIFSGVVTAVPLLWFNAAAKRLPLSTLGFLQYISPTLQFLCAVVLYGEHLTRPHMICFALIWAALAIFAVESLRLARGRRQAMEA